MNVARAMHRRCTIWLRSVAYFLLRAVSKIVRFGKGRRMPTRYHDVALVLPGSADTGDFGSAMNHLAWYFGSVLPGVEEDTRFDCIIPPHLKAVKPEVPRSQREYLEDTSPITLHTWSETSFRDYDFILLWRAQSILHPRLLQLIDRIRPVDSTFYSGIEHASWQIAMEHSVDRQRLSEVQNVSLANLERLLDRWGGSDAVFVLGTGPSVEELFDWDIHGRPVVVCNSLVKNNLLMEHLMPAVICFSDMVFHLGPSEYAATFRDDLLRVIERYGCFAVTRPDGAALLLRHHPELEKYIIGIPMIAGTWQIPSQDFFHVRPASNIMTMYMLPVASKIGKRILIGGADGRKPGETYFWRHGKSVQYDDLMTTAFETHPSFFRDRVYEKYYEEHLRELEGLLAYLERRGLQIENITNTHIPALIRRSTEGQHHQGRKD